MSKTATQIPEVIPGEVVNGAVDFTGQLDQGETLTAVTSVDEIGDSGTFTITNLRVSTTDLSINGELVAAGMAAQFKIDTSPARAQDEPFVFIVTATTSAGQTRKGKTKLKVV